MNFSKVYSAQSVGLNAQVIDVETDISKKTLHAFSVVGLPDKAVEEAKDRISAAVKNSGFTSPKSKNQKIVISLAPADVKKEGPLFDLAIALAYLLASGEVEFDASKRLFLGELSLDGRLRPIKGALPLVVMAKNSGFKEIYLPKANASEAALIDDIKIFGVNTLLEVINHLDISKNRKSENMEMEVQPKTEIVYGDKECEIDLADIKGQDSAKRGLLIAAAGGHNVAMYGPPGTGKTMLAKAFIHLLPKLSFDEILETTSIHSVSGVLHNNLIKYPPLRSPHHTSSYVALVGGGSFPRPGDVTLAHRGVLFMDEFPLFERRVLESLRQPLEDKVISISRAKSSVVFPANFILVAAMNPCPCGNLSSSKKECICLPGDLVRYQRKLSGPIMDRIDLWLQVGEVGYSKLLDYSSTERQTPIFSQKVKKARDLQSQRFASVRIKTNSDMTAKDFKKYINLSDDIKNTLNQAASSLNLSARAYHKVVKLSRTIADLEDSLSIKKEHILEALQYRPKMLN